MRRVFRVVFLVVLALALALGYMFYKRIYGTAVDIEGEESAFYIHTGWTEDDVLSALSEQELIKGERAVGWVMEKKNYTGGLVVPGKYTVKSGMSAADLVNTLRAGRGEEDVNVTFNSARTLYELAGKVASTIEADSTEIANFLLSDEHIAKYGFNRATFKSMFLPDTYRFEWDTNAEQFVQRMADEYKKFWTADRMAKANQLGLSQSEVTTLASIVQAEQQSFPEERPAIAGLYLNRLKRGMRLQSDPTVIYALGDFTINRVLTKQLRTESAYNTYMVKGLPPGPINIPSKQSIDAVLFAEDHNYLYMCAKADFSGYHAFASSLAEHNRNARAFQRALNERKIYR